MKIKNQIHFNSLEKGFLQALDLRDELLDKFLDQNLSFKPLKIYLLNGKDALNKFDNVSISIKVILRGKDATRSEYIQLLKYHLYSFDIYSNSTQSTRVASLAVNSKLRKIKDTFYKKLGNRNISIDSIEGVFITLIIE